MNDFWHCFVPLFVAVDAIGVLPMFIGLTEDLDASTTRRVILQSVVTAAAVALAFVTLGQWVLRLLGITVPDFMIAGGLLLFALSITDLLTMQKHQRLVEPDSVGAVPIGVPLITGPAVLTTSLILLGNYPLWTMVSSLVLNIAIAGAVFWTARPIHRLLGKAGSKTISKLASILLASIAVMMIRKGLLAFR